MKTIWKYPLKVTDRQHVEMPIGAEILTAQFQGDVLCLWALVDSDRSAYERTVEIFGTGHPILVDMGVERRFIATAQESGRALVWHVFERVN